MNNVLVQVQLLVPSLEADAKVTASLKRVEEMTLELESDIKFLDTSSVQKLVLKYGTTITAITITTIIMLKSMIFQTLNYYHDLANHNILYILLLKSCIVKPGNLMRDELMNLLFLFFR